MAGSETKHGSWIEDLLGRIPEAGAVLDVGCWDRSSRGPSAPTAGHRVTGVDISEVQIQRARELVPEAGFIRADAATNRSWLLNAGLEVSHEDFVPEGD